MAVEVKKSALKLDRGRSVRIYRENEMPPLDDDALPPQSPNSGAQLRRRVIDADAHLDAPYEMWSEYLPAGLRDLAPRIENGEEHDWIVFEGKRRPVMMISNQAGREGKDYKMYGRRSEMRPVWRPAAE